MALVLAGVLLRAGLAATYPPVPVSDFKRVVDFAADIAQHGPFVDVWHWTLLSAGTSTLLSPFIALLPGDRESVALVVTMLAMCAVPLIPLLMLRGTIPDAALALVTCVIALHPALILFSGVVAQDNWVQLPAVALTCLAMRNCLRSTKGSPILAAILWGLCIFIRQEMLLALLPLAVASAIPACRSRSRRLAIFALAAACMLALIGGQRYLATGRFAITSEHAGASLLGSYIPGSGFGWIPFESYVATVAPDLADNPDRLAREAGRLVREEVRKRPWFHIKRRIGALVHAATGADGTLAYWSLSSQAQHETRSAGAARLARWMGPWVQAGMILTHALFAAAMLVAMWSRNRPLLILGLAIALKLGIHLVFPSQARFLLAIIPMEAIAAGIAIAVAWSNTRAMFAAGLAAAAAGCALTLLASASREWQAELARSDPPVPMSRATLRSNHTLTRCRLLSGRLVDSSASSVSIMVSHPDPDPGDTARISCRVTSRSPGILRLEVNDPYAPGGFPDRMRQVVRIDDAVVYQHDIADKAGSGWWGISLPPARDSGFEVSVEALRPDRGPAWGSAAITRIRLVERQD